MLDPFRRQDEESIKNSDVLIFKDCAHAGLYENVEEFNKKTMDFLMRHSG